MHVSRSNVHKRYRHVNKNMTALTCTDTTCPHLHMPQRRQDPSGLFLHTSGWLALCHALLN